MTPRTREVIRRTAATHNWMIDSQDSRRDVFWRWTPGGFKEQLTVLYDKGQRVHAWSEWIVERKDLDQEPGMKDRLLDRMSAV